MDRRYAGISIAAILLGAFILIQPIRTTYADIETEGIPAFNGCFSPYINPIFKPELAKDPLSMNTVRNGDIVKTIHAEKEVFLCRTEQGAIPVIVDMTIFVEIFEKISTKQIIKKQAFVVTCVKEGGPDRYLDIITIEGVTELLGCKNEPIPTDATLVRNCSESPFGRVVVVEDEIVETAFRLELTPDHPQEMNTVNKGSIVKTIEAQKEIFACNLDFLSPGTNDATEQVQPDVFFIWPLNEKKVDVITFTEIWEDLSLLPDNPIVKKEFLSVRCVVGLIVDEDSDGTTVPTTIAGELDFDDFELEDFVPRVESCKFTTITD